MATGIVEVACTPVPAPMDTVAPVSTTSPALRVFVPAIVTRELLLRTSPLRPGKWLVAITVAACLAISATYELIEWCAALAMGQAADQFLGTQGDEWDTQWDMFMALVGAVAGLLLLSGRHDRSLARLDDRLRREHKPAGTTP